MSLDSRFVDLQNTEERATLRSTVTHYFMQLTVIKSMVSMNCSLHDDWSYKRVMLQLHGAAGTVKVQNYSRGLTFLGHMHTKSM